jgi:hypothetical protein
MKGRAKKQRRNKINSSHTSQLVARQYWRIQPYACSAQPSFAGHNFYIVAAVDLRLTKKKGMQSWVSWMLRLHLVAVDRHLEKKRVFSNNIYKTRK